MEKDFRLADQKAFSGKPEDLEPLLREAELCFDVQPTIYDTANKKAMYIFALFQDKNAALWKEQYVRQRDGKTLCEGNLYANFKRTLIDNFKDVGSKDGAIANLNNINQGQQSVDTYNTRFRILVQKAGLDEQDNRDMLIHAYSRGLERSLAQNIIL